MVREVRSVSSTGGVKGTKRARFDLIPARAMRLLAEHFGRGAEKYADNNWRKGYEWGKSIAALERHLNAFKDNENYDTCPEDGDGCSFVDAEGKPFETDESNTCFNHTGSLHTVAVMWHAVALTEAFFDHPQFDDRYKPRVFFEGLTEADVDGLKKKAEEFKKRVEDPKRFGGSVKPNSGEVHVTINNPPAESYEETVARLLGKQHLQALMNEGFNRR